MTIQLTAEHAVQSQHYLVDMKYITTLTGMTDKWFYFLMKQHKFPQPIKLGRSSRWRLRDIETWLDNQTKH